MSLATCTSQVGTGLQRARVADNRRRCSAALLVAPGVPGLPPPALAGTRAAQQRALGPGPRCVGRWRWLLLLHAGTHRVPLHVLAHVQADHAALAAKVVVRQTLRRHRGGGQCKACERGLGAGRPAAAARRRRRRRGGAQAPWPLPPCLPTHPPTPSPPANNDGPTNQPPAPTAPTHPPTLVSSVLPTPVGPLKSRVAMGRSGFLSPLLARMMARLVDSTASSCPITALCGHGKGGRGDGWAGWGRGGPGGQAGSAGRSECGALSTLLPE